jgi:hypothetical protein
MHNLSTTCVAMFDGMCPSTQALFGVQSLPGHLPYIRGGEQALKDGGGGLRFFKTTGMAWALAHGHLGGSGGMLPNFGKLDPLRHSGSVFSNQLAYSENH